MKSNIAPIALLAWLLTGSAMALADDAKPMSAPQTCIDVQIGQDRSSYLNCLNNSIKNQVEREQNKAALTAPYSADSHANQVGGFNENAGREQMGNAFGVSPHPQRPIRTFVPALPSR